MRLRHIDRMRAIAVLCMVEVHTAAIVPPEGVTVGHPAAFVAAAIGGMAAPMFIAISGWGIHLSATRRAADPEHDANRWISWLLPRVLLLGLCQLLVNLLLNADRGGRFEWHTPGVLTLLAIAALLAPALVRLSMRARAALMLLMVAAPLAIGDASGPDWSWWERVDSQGASEWLARLLWNGTYPAVPWLGYVLLGYGHTSIELPLFDFLIIVAVVVLLIYLAGRLLLGLLNTPSGLRRFTHRKQIRKARKDLADGLLQMAEGNWKKAEKLVAGAADHSETPVINYLVAAHAAQRQKSPQRRDDYLRQAIQTDHGADVAVGLAQAELIMNRMAEHVIALRGLAQTLRRPVLIERVEQLMVAVGFELARFVPEPEDELLH